MASSVTGSGRVVVKEPAIARKLFSEVGPWSIVWLIVRLYIGWQWFTAGWEKLSGGQWGPDSLKAFWQHAVSVPATGRPPVTYDWYRFFLQFLLDHGAQQWMAWLVAFGELLVGAALILGILVGITAFFGAFMNMNFMLAGAASTNPVLLLLAILLMLAWKTAGWWGFDRWLLPKLGTPWSQVGISPSPSQPRPAPQQGPSGQQ